MAGVENSGKPRIVVPKQNLLLELTENFKILSVGGIEPMFFQELTGDSDYQSDSETTLSYPFIYPLYHQIFVQGPCGINILGCFKYQTTANRKITNEIFFF